MHVFNQSIAEVFFRGKGERIIYLMKILGLSEAIS